MDTLTGVIGMLVVVIFGHFAFPEMTAGELFIAGIGGAILGILLWQTMRKEIP